MSRPGGAITKVAKLTPSAGIFLIGSILGGSAEARPTITMLAAGTTADGINDSGFVAGTITRGARSVFLRSPDGSIVAFAAGYWPYVSAISSSNAIIGLYALSNGTAEGFLINSDGTLTTIDAPDAGGAGDGYGTYPTSINSSGTIAGYYSDKNREVHAFVRTNDGTFTEFDVPQFFTTTANSINDDGTIAGSYLNSEISPIYHSFVRTAQGQITTFDVPDAFYGTIATGINQSGQITGYFFDSSPYNGGRGFVRAADGTFTTFDRDSLPHVIDNKGDVAGVVPHARDGTLGFFRSAKGHFQTFDFQEQKKHAGVAGINAAGTVVGSLTIKDHKKYTSYGFIRTR